MISCNLQIAKQCTSSHNTTHNNLMTPSSFFLQIPAPTAMLELVPVPGLESIHFHPLTAYNNHLETHPVTIETNSNSTSLATKPQIGQQLHRLPIKFQLDDLHSNFVEVR